LYDFSGKGQCDIAKLSGGSRRATKGHGLSRSLSGLIGGPSLGIGEIYDCRENLGAQRKSIGVT